jgi:DNA-binding NtrC family response regulator
VNIPRRILHVDDDPQFTQLVAAHLENYGYEMSAIHDPRQVIEDLPKLKERVMIFDLDMPHINGMELLKKVKSYDGSILVIMLTGIVTQATVIRSLRYGAEACFFKPLTDARPLAEAVSDSYRKLDRWWNTLDELVQRRKDECIATTTDLSVCQVSY